MKLAVAAGMLALALAGCATTPAPERRPFTQDQIDAIGPTTFSVAENNDGVAKAWFYQDSSAATAQYGLAGVIATVIVDSIVNAGPSRRARKAADEVAEVVPVEDLNTALVERLKAEIQSSPADGVTVSNVVLTQKLLKPEALDDTVEVSTSYLLSEDASVLRITASVTYVNANYTYQTPYTFQGSIPKPETEGPIYRNTFTYYSEPLPVPTMSPQMKERLIASIRESYSDENGAPPEEGSKEFRAMQNELKKADDDKLDKSEIAIFLTREWLSDGGARVRAEIEKAQDFFVKYLMVDLNLTDVPSLEGDDELLETQADDRVVRRIGSGVAAGSYVSSAGHLLTFSTYGNVQAVAQVNSDRITDLRRQARDGGDD